jgi:hypothetical protein
MTKPYTYAESELWQKLSQLNPEDVCHRALANYSNNQYIIKFLESKYLISNIERKIVNEQDLMPIDNFEFKLVLLYYLINAKEIPLQNKWISEKQFKQGALFFSNIHRLPQNHIIHLIESDPDIFYHRSKEYGGITREHGDIAIEYRLLPKIPIICIYWKKDEEFPASVQYLFDPSLEIHFPLDVILALVDVFVKKMTHEL